MHLFSKGSHDRTRKWITVSIAKFTVISVLHERCILTLVSKGGGESVRIMLNGAPGDGYCLLHCLYMFKGKIKHTEGILRRY